MALVLRTSVRYVASMAAAPALTHSIPALPKGNAELLARAAQLSRPVTLAGDQVMPTHSVFAPLFPWGGLPRGTVTAASGPAARSLLLALAAGPIAAGAWVAVIGVPSLGLLAASELGLPLHRLVSVQVDGPQGAIALGAAVDAFDVVLVNPSFLRSGDARRVQARARERGSVLLAFGDPCGLEVDTTLQVATAQWHGLHEGHGSLRVRQVTVVATGRRAAARPRRISIWLPDAHGQISTVDEAVVPLRAGGMTRSPSNASELLRATS
jgi:hypothetical protein